MDEVKNDYIKKALNELIPVLGIKEFVDHQKIIILIDSKKTKEAIKTIALYLGLPIEVNISYVPKGYRPSSNDGFHSTHLVKTDNNNQGIGGITAQVSIPSNLPLFGTPSMVNFPISIRLSENCTENPATFISIMAHELSHVVLHSMWHREKENEFYTDLTAMILGFANIMKTGRKIVKTSTSVSSGLLSSTTTTHTETTTYGYLSDDNFNFAFSEIRDILNTQKSNKKKFFKKLCKFEKQLKRDKKIYYSFGKYLNHLDKNLPKKISQEDGYKISMFHQAGYTDNFQSIIKNNEVKLETYFKFIQNLKNYTERNIQNMNQYESQLKLAKEEVEKQTYVFKKDISILEKNIGFISKLKIRFT